METITREEAVDYAINSMTTAERWHIEDAAHLRQCITALREPVEPDPVKKAGPELLAACVAMKDELHLINRTMSLTTTGHDRLGELVRQASAAIATNARPLAKATETPRAS